MNTRITEKTIEKEFLTWADPALNTNNTDAVFTAASSFLGQRHPEYRTTAIAGQLTLAFLKMRNGTFFPHGSRKEVAARQEVLLSLTQHKK